MFPGNVKFISTPRFIEGGAGADCFGNFNLALHVGDESGAVSANRDLLEKHYKLPSSPKWINQTHSSVCVRADSKFSSAEADASYSRTSGVVCGVLTADCMPVFVCDKRGTVVGIAHAGWRGLVGGVVESLIEKMNVALPPLKEFILPGGDEFSARIHLTRAVCRRVERSCVTFIDRGVDKNHWLRYLNRLSDYFFVLARFTTQNSGESETLWERNS